jgi:fido (protein-threonine AMPylation protein)
MYTGMIRVESIQISPQLLAILSELDEFKGAWRALGTLAPDRLLALRRIATIESIGSSTRIEGSTLSDREVERLLGKLDIQAFATRDEQEVAGYAEVMETVFQSWADIRLSENHVRQLHRDLLRHSSKDERHRGEYKTLRNDVGAFDETGKMIGVVFETATPFDTPRRMAELFAWIDEARTNARLHPLLIVAVFVVVFLAIHPFQDGNGRLSRILTTLLLLQAGYVYVPYSSLESVIEGSKDAYYRRAAPNPGHAGHGYAGLAAMAALLFACAAAAEAQSRREGGAGAGGRGAHIARRRYSGLRTRTWSRHNARHGPSARCESQHPQVHVSQSGRAGAARAPRWRAVDVVCIALGCEQAPNTDRTTGCWPKWMSANVQLLRAERR